MLYYIHLPNAIYMKYAFTVFHIQLSCMIFFSICIFLLVFATVLYIYHLHAKVVYVDKTYTFFSHKNVYEFA